MWDVFISYAREDRDHAFEIAEALRSRGIKVWWDFDLVGGENFRRRIRDVIDTTPKVLVLWSKTSVDSAFVIDEASEARKQGKLVPVSIDGSSPPFGFGDLHTIPLSRDLANIEGVSAAITGSSQQLLSSRVVRRTRRSLFAWLGAAGLATVAGSSGWAYWRHLSQASNDPSAETADQSNLAATNLNRFALVIGNGDYETMSPVMNTDRDAHLISKALEQRGFKVVKRTDLKHKEMAAEIRDFEKGLSRTGGVGVFYYTGHAACVGGKDVMMPIDVRVDWSAGIVSGGLFLNELQEEIRAETTTTFEDNGTAVLYSASEGELTSAGPPGGNSPFTNAFVEALSHPGRELADVFKGIRLKMSSKPEPNLPKQTPYIESSASVDFYFNDPSFDKKIGVLKILIFDSCRGDPFDGKVAFL